MFVHTKISSDNDGIQLSGLLGKGGYNQCSLVFYDLQGDMYRKPHHEIHDVWANPEYLINDLYPEICKFCDLNHMEDYELDNSIISSLDASNTDPFELKDIMDQAISIGMFGNFYLVSPFKIINQIAEG